jgi:hypothetical protein
MYVSSSPKLCLLQLSVSYSKKNTNLIFLKDVLWILWPF